MIAGVSRMAGPHMHPKTTTETSHFFILSHTKPSRKFDQVFIEPGEKGTLIRMHPSGPMRLATLIELEFATFDRADDLKGKRNRRLEEFAA
jgi:hypothetical protein